MIAKMQQTPQSFNSQFWAKSRSKAAEWKQEVLVANVFTWVKAQERKMHFLILIKLIV